MTGQDAAPGEGTAAEEPTGDHTTAEEQPGEGAAAGKPTGTDASPAGPPAGAGSGLDETDREILAIENLQWKYQGAKEMEIRRRLGLSPTHYYQRLNVLIDSRAALEHDPMLVGRLRRQRGDLG